MRLRSMTMLLILCATPFACVVSGAAPPVQAGNGLKDGNGKIAVDPNEVPVLPSCAAGQLVGKGSNGWECFTPAQPSVIQAGDGISVESDTIGFDASTVPATDVWPGTMPYSQLTDAPTPYTDAQARAAVTWSSLGPTIQSTDAWPGTMSYSQLTDAPSPYTDAQAQAAVTWSSLKGSVQPTDDWPGTITYAQVVGAPNLPPPATWSIIQPSVTSSTDWPGTVPYARVTGAPGAATWSSLAPSVSGSSPWPGTMPYSHLTNLPADLGTVASDVSNLKTQMTSATSSITTINGQLTTANAAIDTLNTKATSAKSSIDTLNTEVAGLQTTTSEATYATFSDAPSSPADGARAFVKANLCHYVYDTSATRWEVVSCDFYPDWAETTSNAVTFSGPTGSALATSFLLSDSVATRDYLYGVDYSGHAQTTNFVLEPGNLNTDDAAAPSRIGGRWQRCGYTVGGQSVCLPYLGMLRDTAANAFEDGWYRIGGDTNIGLVTDLPAYTTNVNQTVSLESWTTQATESCTVLMDFAGGGSFSLGTFGGHTLPTCSGLSAAYHFSCVIPMVGGGSRGFSETSTGDYHAYMVEHCTESR